MNKLSIDDVKSALMQYYDAEKAEVLPRFFKTGKGEYGEGDVFIGVAVPNVRKVAKECRDASFELIEQLLDSKTHECRSCALFILVDQFKRAKKDAARQKEIFDFYLAHTHRINNWDLVDCSAPYIVGEYLADRPRDILYRLLDDPLLWNKRIAIVANWMIIRHHDYSEIFSLTERLLATEPKPHDLMQKACGWMLREVERNGGLDMLEDFLEKHAATMPRTMLRYAIEHLSPETRRYYMNKKNI